MSRRIFTLLILVVVSFGLILGGCSQSASKKPNAKYTPGGQATTPKQSETKTTRDSTLTRTAKKPVTTTNTSESRKLAEKLTGIVVKVSGVKSATIVVQPANNTYAALVGLTLNSGVSGKETTTVKNTVIKRVKAADKRINRVMVTTNPDLVKRIEDIARGVLAGKPIQSFADEISELSRRIAPTLK